MYYFLTLQTPIEVIFVGEKKNEKTGNFRDNTQKFHEQT